MTRAEVFRHNEVEGISDCFLCRVAEDPLGAVVPKSDQAAEISVNDRVRPFMDQFPREPVGVESEMAARRHHSNPLLRWRVGG
jgi:hypothetical protein